MNISLEGSEFCKLFKEVNLYRSLKGYRVEINGGIIGEGEREGGREGERKKEIFFST